MIFMEQEARNEFFYASTDNMCMLISHSTPSSSRISVNVIDSRMANTAVNTHDSYAIRENFLLLIFLLFF